MLEDKFESKSELTEGPYQLGWTLFEGEAPHPNFYHFFSSKDSSNAAN